MLRYSPDLGCHLFFDFSHNFSSLRIRCFFFRMINRKNASQYLCSRFLTSSHLSVTAGKSEVQRANVAPEESGIIFQITI